MRIFSTLVLWAVTILIIVYAKSFGWTLILALLSAGALHESCQILAKIGFRPLLAQAHVANIAIFAGSWAMSQSGCFSIASGAAIFGVCAAGMGFLIIRDPHGELFEKSVLPTVAALFCIPFMLQWLALLGVCAISPKSEYTGIIFAIWILAAAKFSDVGAYVIGSAFGRHKMAPSMSPNKTWEGAIGGIFGSMAISAAIAWGFADILPYSFNPLSAALGGAVIGAVAIISDLLESVFKRRAGVKDSGAVIPGIGGALDLADSILLSAPVGILLLTAILHS